MDFKYKNGNNNWVAIGSNGTILNIQIPEDVINNPKAYCNSKEGKIYLEFSNKLMDIIYGQTQPFSQEIENKMNELINEYGEKYGEKYGFKNSVRADFKF